MTRSEAKMDFRVLIVDDAVENISLLVNILKDKYHVSTAKDGKTALEMAQKEPQPDLILLDVLMPNIDGYEVCKKLKEADDTKDIPVIFLTVLDEAGDITKGFEVGGVDYVTKPFEPTVLLARVKTHCELSMRQKELIRFNEQLEETVEARTKEILKKDELLRIQSRQAAMGNMISMIAHQWRQPISVISMIANNVLIDLELGVDPNKDALIAQMNDVVRNTQYLSTTIENFRDFFRPNKPKEDFTVSKFFEILHNMVAKSFTNNDIKLELNIKEDITLRTYKNELLQVFLNIVNNAKDALVSSGAKSGFVKIDTWVEADSLKVSVCDNGGGFSTDIETRMGEPYFTTKDEKNGTGLGLYMSKTIIEEHIKGRLEWENKDGGACFLITIPL